MEWKLDLYAKVAPFVRPDAIFASNTSGLSINALAEGMPAEARARFCGIHFFNPPRYMALVELIATRTTDPATLDGLESLADHAPGQGRRSRQGHPQLRRQPGRRVLHPGGDAPHRRAWASASTKWMPSPAR
jgi:3-hydroxyacyl-CoA dehydrogenase